MEDGLRVLPSSAWSGGSLRRQGVSHLSQRPLGLALCCLYVSELLTSTDRVWLILTTPLPLQVPPIALNMQLRVSLGSQ